MSACLNVPSPIGNLTLYAEGDAVTALLMDMGQAKPPDEPSPVLRVLASELEAYFAGELRDFSVPLSPKGTAFQRRVWDALVQIPYGETTTYGELARRLSDPNATRAVGLANGKNPIAIVIPCHRVIGASGRLVGFGGGLDRKRALLTLEGAGQGGAGRAQPNLFAPE